MSKKAVLLLCILSAMVQLTALSPGVYQVSVRETIVRERPSFLGKVLTSLTYGEKVKVVDSHGAWSFIEYTGSSQGWIHTAAISSQKIELTRSDKGVDTSASNDEVALAGKGFNKEVEQQYIDQNSMDYSWIDYMETIEVDIVTLVEFTNEEALNLEGVQ